MCVISCNLRYTVQSASYSVFVPCNLRYTLLFVVVLGILRYTAQSASYNVICIIQYNPLHIVQLVLQ